MSLRSSLLSLHGKLIPEESGQGYLPYVWLVYLLFLFFPLFFQTHSVENWLVSIVSCVLFVGLYFWIYWQGVVGGLVGVAIICLMGSVVVDYTPGASVFFVYAGAFAFKAGSPKKAMLILGLIILYIGLYSYFRGLDWFFAFPAIFFTSIIGGINIYQREMEKKNRLIRLSQEELKRVAATAERERIARDLHDLIGHTLSIITMKTQLANKLIDIDIDRAKQELKELELISRQTLTDVREAVTGFKARDLASELANAKEVLQSSDIRFIVDVAKPLPSGKANQILAFALRELITNVVRHSHATQCKLIIDNTKSETHFVFSDNGDCDTAELGNGLSGLKERVESAKGSFNLNTKIGFSIEIGLPS